MIERYKSWPALLEKRVCPGQDEYVKRNFFLKRGDEKMPEITFKNNYYVFLKTNLMSFNGVAQENMSK